MRKRTAPIPGKNIAPGFARTPGLISTAPPTGINLSRQLLQGKYRRLTRKHLEGIPGKLFAEFTGLHFHVTWAPVASKEWNAHALPTACSVCCRIAGTSLEAQPTCRICGPKQLVRALKAQGEGLAFKCRLGVQNFWLPIHIGDFMVGIAYLQALDRSHPASRRNQAPRTVARTLSQSQFRRAARLLRLLIQHVQALELAELRQTDLANAENAVLALKKEQARLYEAIQKRLPDTAPVDQRACAEPQPDQIVRDLVAHLEHDYAKPITLQKYADTLTMNSAYLSDLFSRAVGVPFKAYLTELRMEKARQLLGDAHYNVSEIAAAVGYASENRFRVAFKKNTGLAPKLWRETMRVSSQPPQ